MSRKLIRATVPMCPECGSEFAGMPHWDQMDIGWTCAGHGFVSTGQVVYGYYAPETDWVAENLRRFAGDRDWEFEDGEPADLQGWADILKGTK